ncbi:MAG: hypothetical protein ACRDSK_22135 [Actinophytocola sp.]|uniref:GHMP family kinase ATP-binding protein n=1 Tax=Actinophytocola sp. TaxID=1872138 RepID=UPI003D6BA5C2
MRHGPQLSTSTARPGPAATSSEVGIGHAPAHHGELLQGVFADEDGRMRRALVTLPQPELRSRAIFHPSHHHWGVVGTPELEKVRRAAARALREFGARPAAAKGGWIEITSDVPRGIGMGSSTADVTAAIRAVADYHGVALSVAQVARLAVSAECASDSVMIDGRVVLFAHRDGVVLESLGDQLPPMTVVGCDTDPSGAGVDTLALRPAEYDEREILVLEALRAALRHAVAAGDVALLAEVSTESARLNQRFLAKPALEPLLELSDGCGALGIQVAHSGTVAGLIFDPRLPDTESNVATARAGLADLGLPETTVIRVPSQTADEPVLPRVEVIAG